MKTKTLNIVLSFLIAGLLICIGLIIRQNMQFSSLQAKLAETEFHVYQAEKASDIVLANRSPITQVRPLSSGIYELKTEVAVDPNEYERGMYTVYHMVLNIEVGGTKRKFQFGYGSSSVLSHIFYFDYDNDGKIDTGMMEEYAESIPVVGEVVSWLFDPELSQSLYNAFRLNSGDAKKLTVDEIASRVGSRLDVVWEWTKETSDDFGTWVENALEFE